MRSFYNKSIDKTVIITDMLPMKEMVDVYSVDTRKKHSVWNGAYVKYLVSDDYIILPEGSLDFIIPILPIELPINNELDRFYSWNNSFIRVNRAKFQDCIVI